MPVCSRYQAIDRSSHSAAFGAVHGSSSGSFFASRSSSQLRPRDGAHGERADLRDEAGVATGLALADEEVRARHVGLVGRDAHLACEPEDRVVLGTEPRSPAIDTEPFASTLGPDPPTDAVSRFEHDH